MSVSFWIEGQDFIALNGGVSWQIIPKALGEMLEDPDPAKSDGVWKAMIQMEKIDIKGLQQAYNQS